MDKGIKTFEFYKGKIRKRINLFSNKISYVNLLSVYDMLICERMAKSLVVKLINEGFERRKAITVAENSCLSTLCLTDENAQSIFENTADLMKKLTAEDVLFIVKEYNTLRKEYMGFDEFNNEQLECIKKN